MQMSIGDVVLTKAMGGQHAAYVVGDTLRQSSATACTAGDSSEQGCSRRQSLH